ncbi:hypothetical protein BJX62DRAFT_75486 [Aspergillus germanicus]
MTCRFLDRSKLPLSSMIILALVSCQVSLATFPTLLPLILLCVHCRVDHLEQPATCIITNLALIFSSLYMDLISDTCSHSICLLTYFLLILSGGETSFIGVPVILPLLLLMGYLSSTFVLRYTWLQ